ncbi:MAG: hypothetical protein ACRDYF_08350 [Acidimicrobiia bacterium]
MAVQLRMDVLLTEAAAGLGEQRRALGPQPAAVGVDDEELLLHPDRPSVRRHGASIPR